LVSDRRRQVRAGAAARHAAREAAGGPHGGGCPPGLAEPAARDARRLLRGKGRKHRRAGAMKKLGWIAINGFREAVRDKVMYSLVAFAILLIGTSYIVGELTAGQDVKIIKDLGLSSIGVFGLFMAIFIGIGLVSKEVERRSVYALLAKPIRRGDLVLGRYLGL